MKFTKMNGLGNDYIFVDTAVERISDPSKTAIILSDRHRGVGSDGLVLIEPDEKYDCAMKMYNADGTEGETCGNALRCIAKYLYDKGKINKKELSVKTKAGIAYLRIKADKGVVKRVEVNLGECSPYYNGKFLTQLITSIGILTVYPVNIGNPHCIVFTGEITDELFSVGKEISENRRLFRDGTNVEFVTIISDERIKMRVYERGTGETRACGSGAAASYYVAQQLGLVHNYTTVELPGGELTCSHNEKGEILIEGEAEFCYEGEIYEEDTLWQRLI